MQLVKLILSAGFSFALALANLAAYAQAPAPTLPYKAHSVTTPDGIKLNVQEWGNPSGPEILFVHGFSQSYLAWHKQFNSDLAKTFRIVTYDTRGHGFSDKPTAPEFYKDSKRWGDEVKAVIDQTGLKRPVLVGASYAGRTLSDYLITHGDGSIAGINFVAAVTNGPLNSTAPALALAGGTFSDDMARNIVATRTFLRAWFTVQPSAEEFETIMAYNMLTPNIVRRNMLGRPTAYEPMLKSLKVPVLVTHGLDDQALLHKVSQYTAATVPGAKLSEYPNVGHAPHWEQAARFNKELSEFVLAAQK
jgi:non-heme chloroperoxidase